MKVLIAHPDPAPGGFNFCESHELLMFPKTVCRRRDCGCDRSWSGSRTRKGATLAKVVETPACFTPKSDLIHDPYLQRALAVAERHPVGTLLRVRFDWTVGRADDDVEPFLTACVVTIEGPN